MRSLLHARYVFPVSGDPIPDGVVCIDGDRIASCGPGDAFALQGICDLGNVAILPGLVNAHVHLDFSDLPAPLGHRGISFVDWVRRVMKFRGQAAPDRQAVGLGLDESLRGGVTALGDIVQPGRQTADSPLNITAFIELIAPTADRVAGAAQLAKSHLAATRTSRIHPGLSPHAPYSVHPGLLAAVVELSNRYEVPVAMHLAESPEELELLRDNSGPLRTFLEELGAWDGTAIALGTRPLDYLRRLAVAQRSVVIHGNYLDDEEIAFLADNAERMSVVYCPRTHDWFAHRRYPLGKMLAAGVTVALGTDGRGSSPDLSLLAEMRTAAEKHSDIAPHDILKMGTLNGAIALGREAELGSLVPGKQADLAIVALPDRAAADPHELLFDPSAAVAACYSRGVETYRSGNAAIS
jgi:aminodeoxyfutalosine deaminase